MALPRATRLVLVVLLVTGVALLVWGPWRAHTMGRAPATEGRDALPVGPLGPALQGAPRLEPTPTSPADPASASVDAALDIPPEDRIRLTVVDAANDEAAAGVRIAWLASRTSTATETAPGTTSDARGQVTVPRSNLSRLRTPEGWRLLVRTDEETVGDGRLLVLRILQVRVHVTTLPGSAAPGPSGLRVWLEPQRFQQVDREGQPVPFSVDWLRRFRLDQPTEAGAAAEMGGAVSLAVPWCRGWVAKARADGWVAEPAEVPPPSGPDAREVEVRLVLAPLPRLRVRVSVPAGNVAFQATVQCSAKLEFARFEQAERAAERGRFPDQHVTTLRRTDGGGVAIFARSARADAEGWLVFDLPGRAQVTLVTRLQGTRTDVRTLTAGRDLELAVALAPHSGERVPVTRGGQPVRGLNLMWDATDPDVQVPVGLPFGRDGYIPADDLVEGRAYHFPLPEPGGSSRYLRWDRRAAIELDDLEPDFERFYGRAR